MNWMTEQRVRNGRRASLARRAILVIIAWPLLAAAAQDTARIRHVIDGDTFVLESGERIRIAGIDAPETHVGQAKCRDEIARGEKATRKARALLAGQRVGIDRVGRSYGRTVARVSLNGRDVARDLVSRGAARGWPRGAPRPDWCNMPVRR